MCASCFGTGPRSYIDVGPSRLDFLALSHNDGKLLFHISPLDCVISVSQLSRLTCSARGGCKCIPKLSRVTVRRYSQGKGHPRICH